MSQATGFFLATSSVTSRTIIVNKSDSRFLISPTFHPAKVRDAAQAFNEHARTISKRFNNSKVMLPFYRFAKVRSTETFADALADLMAPDSSMSLKERKWRSARLPDILGGLYVHGCLIWPRNYSPILGRTQGLSKLPWGVDENGSGPQSVIQLYQDGPILHKSRTAQVLHKSILIDLILSTWGISEIGDITPEVIDGRLTGNVWASGFVSTLLEVMRQQHGPGAITFSLDSFAIYNKALQRSSDDFQWVAETDPSMKLWQSAAIEYFKEHLRGRARKRNAINLFFDFVISTDTFPRDPIDALSAGFHFPEIPGFEVDRVGESARGRNTLASFFDWLLDKRYMTASNNASPGRLTGFRNPLSITTVASSPYVETHREPIPTRYLRILREILEENDFAWPKQLATRRNVDMKLWKDPKTSQWTKVWSPVRACAILLKLILPLRTFQVRMLNSGEADRLRLDIETGQWLVNQHVLADQREVSIQKGVLRPIWDATLRRHRVGLYINTNKTADISLSEDQRGYVIPWENKEVISLVATLRTWQEMYNPISRLVPWTELAEVSVRGHASEEILAERGAETFLFRDAASKRPDQPVAAIRLQMFWYDLCDELERRLKRFGEVGAPNAPASVVKRNTKGAVIGTLYDLHSLRVSLISAWSEQGVPVEVLLKIAGHCTAVMTMYYMKYPMLHITEALNKADFARHTNEQTTWERAVGASRNSTERLEQLVAYNDRSSLQAVSEGTGSSWQRRDHGVCPVGCARCHEGGQLLSDNAVGKVYAPVPGGSQNCVRCRFFITGPAFLMGLVAYFNDISLRYREQSAKWQLADKEFLRLDLERRKSQEDGQLFRDRSAWHTASMIVDQRARETDELALTFHATFRLIQKCQALLQDSISGPDLKESKTALVTVGSLRDLEFVLEVDERGEREFELLDSVCQSSVWFTSIECKRPNLQRMRYFDNMLQRHGYGAAFLSLSEDEALLVGNELARFMFTQFGRERTNALMAGALVLRDLGLDAEASVIELIDRGFRKARAIRSTSNGSSSINSH